VFIAAGREAWRCVFHFATMRVDKNCAPGYECAALAAAAAAGGVAGWRDCDLAKRPA
jgi:hypothetical protein